MTDPANLASFFAHVGAVNPFLDNRINGPSPADVDVPTVHQSAFVRLTELARESLAARRALGAVLWGEPASQEPPAGTPGSLGRRGGRLLPLPAQPPGSPNSCRARCSTPSSAC